MNITYNKNTLIDQCTNFTSDFNIALVIHFILKNNYRYIGNNKWEYLSNDKMWNHDIKNKKFKNDIEHYVCNEFLNRIIILTTLNDKLNNIDEINDNDIKIKNLLFCSNKLKNKNYLLTIIKEAKSFFEDNEN